MAETSPENATESAPALSAPQHVECPAAKDPAVRLFILAAMLLGFGVYSLYDLHMTDQYPYVPASEDLNAFGRWAFNALGAYVLFPLGFIPLIWGLVFLRRKLVADQEGIGYVGRQRICWGDVRELDAGRLKDKGVLVLHYSDGKLVLDSWKLQNFRELVTLVESKVEPGEGDKPAPAESA
jgi:hypothetical protein